MCMLYELFINVTFLSFPASPKDTMRKKDVYNKFALIEKYVHRLDIHYLLTVTKKEKKPYNGIVHKKKKKTIAMFMNIYFKFYKLNPD